MQYLRLPHLVIRGAYVRGTRLSAVFLLLRSSGWLPLALIFALLLSGTLRAQGDRWAPLRYRMVQSEIVQAGIEDQRVISALLATPRHLFVPSAQRNKAYLDMALPIGKGQTISPPFIVAFMTETLEPSPEDKVLEIGTGSGYQAAVLSPLVEEVYSIEIVESLGRSAHRTLQRLKYENVHTKIGDGFQGWAEHAPFDKIIVTCSPQEIPDALVEQLRDGGRMVIPLGERYQQTLYLFKKVDGQLESEPLEPTFFVPMTGRAEELRVSEDDSGIPELQNGSFESTDDEGQLLAWYYVRQAEVASDPQSPHGKHHLWFRNQTPGRGAQALQAVGVDGRKVRALDLSLWVRTDNVRPGQSPQQLPRVELSFFDEKQAPVGARTAGPWYGTSRWVKKETRIPVPSQARLAVLAVGMFGAVGEMAVDRVELRVAADN